MSDNLSVSEDQPIEPTSQEDEITLTKEDVKWLREQRQKMTMEPEEEKVQQIAVLKVEEPEEPEEAEEPEKKIEIEINEKKNPSKSKSKQATKRVQLFKVKR